MMDFKKVPKGAQRWDNNEPVIVMRPLNVGLTLSLSKVALAHQNEEALKEAVTGPCQFLGFLTRQEDGKLCVVDEDGENPLPLGAGDILVEPSMLQQPD
jgi:hypothetical protein